MTMPCEPMPLLVPKRDRKAGDVQRELVRREDLLLHGEPHAAVLFRDRHSEQAEFLHLLDQVGGDLVGLGDLGLEGNQTFPDEAGNRTEEDV